jgi:hypothetical protein
MKKYVLIEKKLKAGKETLTLSNIEVSVLGSFNHENELRAQLKVMKNLQDAGRLDPKMSMEVLEVDFDGEA